MKKLILTAAALIMVFAASGCGEKKETPDSYARKLVSGEIKPGGEINDESGKSESGKKLSSETETPYLQLPDEKDEDIVEPNEEPKVQLAVSEEEMGEIIDGIANEYTSFTIEPIESGDFFTGKKLRVSAVVEDHDMKFMYDSNITAAFTHSSLTMEYQSGGKQQKDEYIVYVVSDEVKTTAGGNQYTYTAYGSEEILSESTNGTIAVLCKIKMADDIEMQDGGADSYVMLIETSNPGVYQIFKVEE